MTPFVPGKFWNERVLDADAIWQQVKSVLEKHNTEMPETPRRPDVRLIVNNTSGDFIEFLNPGDHSNNKQELIPPSGDNTAAMVMVKGDDLCTQQSNAARLYETYNLGANGFSPEFLNDLKFGKLEPYIQEAYGPAPFTGQAKKLVDLEWSAGGNVLTLKPVFGEAAAYGARKIEKEKVFLVKYHIAMRGTGTVAEEFKDNGMYVAIAVAWDTKKESTRPIAPEVAATFYGDYLKDIPVAEVTPEGVLREFKFSNGMTLYNDQPSIVSAYQLFLDNLDLPTN